MTLNVLIVDDEALARSRLRTLLADCRTPAATAGGEAANASQAIEQLRRGDFDLALIDIHMPGADGLALAASLRALPRPPAVVFVTAHAEHAVQAFELEAVDYLTKPVRLERLQTALQKTQRLAALRQAPSRAVAEEFLVIQDRGRSERVPLSEVVYLKAELKYVTVRTASRSYVLDGALNELEDRYASHFLRIHRNARPRGGRGLGDPPERCRRTAGGIPAPAGRGQGPDPADLRRPVAARLRRHHPVAIV
jgi:two-component system, LytTR family, response regulator AlgR